MPANKPNEARRIPPELEQPLPRRIRLTGIGIAYCVIALGCIAFGVYMTAKICLEELHREAANDSVTRRLTTEGGETDATVTDMRTGLGYVVFFDYTIDGRHYQRGALISLEHWQSLQVGSSLAIRYLPSDPHQAYPVTDPPNSQNHWSTSLPMVGMILLFMFGFAAVYLSLVLPQRRLLARGSPAQGIVTRCKEGHRGRSSGYYLYYDFSVPEGSHCQGKAFRSQPMAEGSAVTILFDRDRPRRNTLYPLDMVRLAAL